ncbi:hypothetical protein ACHWQZ_G014892 [Mnemiopsis leidyi]
MEFSVSALHELESKVENLSDTISAKLRCGKLQDLTSDLFKHKSVTKELLTAIVLQMGTLICDSKMVLRSACEKIDEQKSDLIQTKNELIKYKSVKLEAVKETVQSEMKSFSDVVKSKSVSSGLSPAKIKMAVHSAMRDEDRAKNFIIFGAEEELECEEEEMSDKDLVLKDIFGIVKGGDERSIIKCERVGVKKSTDAKRPIKVTVKDAETVRDVLSKAKILKSFQSPGVFKC